jgi:hypothetical protein
MITPVVSIVILAILFAVFGLLKPRAGCGSECDQCTHGCDFNKDGPHV